MHCGDRGDPEALQKCTEVMEEIGPYTRLLEHNLMETMAANVYGATSPANTWVLKREINNLREKMTENGQDLGKCIHTAVSLLHAGWMIAEEREERADWARPEEKERISRRTSRVFDRYAKAANLALKLKQINKR